MTTDQPIETTMTNDMVLARRPPTDQRIEQEPRTNDMVGSSMSPPVAQVLPLSLSQACFPTSCFPTWDKSPFHSSQEECSRLPADSTYSNLTSPTLGPFPGAANDMAIFFKGNHVLDKGFLLADGGYVLDDGHRQSPPDSSLPVHPTRGMF
jgi:hypothetical protein